MRKGHTHFVWDIHTGLAIVVSLLGFSTLCLGHPHWYSLHFVWAKQRLGYYCVAAGILHILSGQSGGSAIVVSLLVFYTYCLGKAEARLLLCRCWYSTHIVWAKRRRGYCCVAVGILHILSGQSGGAAIVVSLLVFYTFCLGKAEVRLLLCRCWYSTHIVWAKRRRDYCCVAVGILHTLSGQSRGSAIVSLLVFSTLCLGKAEARLLCRCWYSPHFVWAKQRRGCCVAAGIKDENGKGKNQLFWSVLV